MASVPDSSLEIGLAELSCGNYPAAIAHLEVVCQTQMNHSSRVRAQMGLVVAYERQGKTAKAIMLCQELSQNTNPQVREWADSTINALTNRHPEMDVTNFTSPVTNNASGQDNTGFIAFDSPPPPASPSPPPLPSPKLNTEWRQAGRAKRWQPLEAVSLLPLWLLQAGCMVALFWLLNELLKFAMLFTNDLLVKLPYLEPFQPFYRQPTYFVLLMLVVLISLSPWLLDTLLRVFYGLQPLSTNTLSTHSPEAIRVMQRYCRQRGWTLPQLSILPTSAPMALTYGNLPRTARIVITQGLLEQLADDEIATVYASQLGHIAHWDFVVMSLFILIAQLPYNVYWQVSLWGDRRSNSILRLIAAAIATLAYGIWCLLSAPALWLSQVRIYYSDRLAAEITGNPNALTRALLKIGQGIAGNIQQQGYTSWLLESWDLLTTVGYRQSLSLFSLHLCDQFEHALTWDCLNPYRHWLIINSTHPLIGDRLQRLAQIAHHWHLETELNLNRRIQELEVIDRTPFTKDIDTRSADCRVGQAQSFLLQVAPFFGIPLGFALGGLTWLLGGIAALLGSAQMAWMYGDWLLIKGYLAIGFSIGTFVRINSFFPDIKPSTTQPDPSLLYLLADPTSLPIDSQPVRIHGKLLGRRGISNWLGQDLILQSPTGLVKLHHVPWLGAVGNFFLTQSSSPRYLLGQHIVTTGWFRRGATSWIDIDTLRTQRGKTSHSNHPVWSTLLATAAAVWGAYTILWG